MTKRYFLGYLTFLVYTGYTRYIPCVYGSQKAINKEKLV